METPGNPPTAYWKIQISHSSNFRGSKYHKTPINVFPVACGLLTEQNRDYPSVPTGKIVTLILENSVLRWAWKMSDHDQWCIATDGSFSVGEKSLSGLEYHQKLNLLLITSEESGIHVYDTTSSTLLKKTNASSTSAGTVLFHSNKE